MKKRALIAANQAGFATFLISDIDILQNMGYEIVYAANGELPWEDTRAKLVERNVEFIQIDFDTKNPLAKRNLKAYRQIRELLKQYDFDLVHCHTPITGFAARLAARKYRRKGCKVIYTTHGFAFTKYSSKKSWLTYYNFEKLTSGMCDAMITINQEDFHNAEKMNCKNVYYINGVGVKIDDYRNTDINKNEYREKLGVPSDKIMILSVGELSDRKNHRVIIEAISMLENKQDYVYVICGNGINGGTGKMLQKLAKEKQVDLRLLGFRFDIPEITKISDIGSIPSIREGLGLAGVQSLAAGIPLLASNVQGICDYAIEGKTGYLCNPYSAEEFAEAIKKLSDSALRQSMEKECCKIAELFDMSASEKQRIEIYEEILGINKDDTEWKQERSIRILQ